MEHSTRYTFPCHIGDIVYIYESNKFFDYSTRKDMPAGVYAFQVTNMSISINKQEETKTSVRLYLYLDGKTHDVQRQVRFEDFGVTVFYDKDKAVEAYEWKKLIKKEN